MNKIYVDDVVCKVVKDMGPCPGDVGVAVKFREGDSPAKWLTSIEVTGIPSFYSSDERILEKLLDEDDQFDFAEQDELNERYYIKSFSDIELGEYEELLDSLDKSQDLEAASLIKYLIVVTRCEIEQADEYITLAKGKHIGSIEVDEALKSMFEWRYSHA